MSQQRKEKAGTMEENKGNHSDGSLCSEPIEGLCIEGMRSGAKAEGLVLEGWM